MRDVVWMAEECSLRLIHTIKISTWHCTRNHMPNNEGGVCYMGAELCGVDAWVINPDAIVSTCKCFFSPTRRMWPLQRIYFRVKCIFGYNYRHFISLSLLAEHFSPCTRYTRHVFRHYYFFLKGPVLRLYHFRCIYTTSTRPNFDTFNTNKHSYAHDHHSNTSNSPRTLQMKLIYRTH